MLFQGDIIVDGGANVAQWLTFVAAILAFGGTLVLAFFAWRSVKRAGDATEAMRAQTAPLLEMSGGFGTQRELSDLVELRLTVENVGLGPAVRIQVEVNHERFSFHDRSFFARAPGKSRTLFWRTGIVDDGSIPPYSDDFSDQFEVSATYHDVEQRNGYVAQFSAHPSYNELADDTYPTSIRFELIALERST